MPAQTSSDAYTIRHAAVARVFGNERTLRILLMFGPRPRSVSQVAAALDEPIAKIFYHVTSFVRQGLLVVTHEEARQGKPIRYYQTVARSFLLPEALIDRPCTQGLSEELRRLLDATLADVEIEGVLFSADEEGGINMSLCPQDARKLVPAVEIWHMMKLPSEAAAALASDLAELLARYERLSGEGKELLVHAAIAPRRPR